MCENIAKNAAIEATEDETGIGYVAWTTPEIGVFLFQCHEC